MSSKSKEKISISAPEKEINNFLSMFNSGKKRVIMNEEIKKAIKPSNVLSLMILILPNNLPIMLAILSEIERNKSEITAIFFGNKSARKKAEKHIHVAPVMNFCSCFFIISPKNSLKNFLKDLTSNLRKSAVKNPPKKKAISGK